MTRSTIFNEMILITYPSPPKIKMLFFEITDRWPVKKEREVQG